MINRRRSPRPHSPDSAEGRRRPGPLSTALRGLGTLVAAGAATAATTAAAAFVETRAFVLHEVTVPALAPGTLKDGQDAFRILHISDLHMLANQRLKQDWVTNLDLLEPDLVVNTGDNLGEDGAVPAVLRAVGPLLRRPGVFIFGSNDYYAPHPVNPFNYLLGKRNKPSEVELPWRGMRAAFVEHGWEDATHRRVDFATAGVKLAVGGVDDPHLDRDDYEALGGPPNPEADLAIGLAHSPEPRVLDEFAADGYQLMMSGHTHGGQLCLPGGRAIITNCGLDRSRASGLSRWSQRMWLHVTNGLGTSKYVPFRLFCRPSATLVRVVEQPS